MNGWLFVLVLSQESEHYHFGEKERMIQTRSCAIFCKVCMSSAFSFKKRTGRLIEKIRNTCHLLGIVQICKDQRAWKYISRYLLYSWPLSFYFHYQAEIKKSDSPAYEPVASYLETSAKRRLLLLIGKLSGKYREQCWIVRASTM